MAWLTSSPPPPLPRTSPPTHVNPIPVRCPPCCCLHVSCDIASGVWDVCVALCTSSLCCVCGVGITPNPSSMCMVCLSSRVDITEGIPKQIVIYQCRECLRYGIVLGVACEQHQGCDCGLVCGTQRPPPTEFPVRLHAVPCSGTSDHPGWRATWSPRSYWPFASRRSLGFKKSGWWMRGSCTPSRTLAA